MSTAYPPHESPADAVILAMRPSTYPPSPRHPEKLTQLTQPISLDPSNRVHYNTEPVSEMLYSGFIEHLGRCIYGGLVDTPDDPSPKELLVEQENGRPAWRKDVFDIIKRDGELEIPMMRWPGGNFVSNYHWQDGIGPLEHRPKRIELAWLGKPESNQFGTDEFIQYCREAKMEPFICLNMGTGTFEEALAWVEYCNGTGDTHWANLRRKNTGRDEPHNVKYWGLGNEMWGSWQVGNLDATEYAKIAKRWAKGIRLVDPTVKLVSCGESGATEWDREVISTLIPYVDLHSIHYYTTFYFQDKTLYVPGNEYEENAFGPAAAEKFIEVCKSFIDAANIQRSFVRQTGRDLKIAFDEWNVWDDRKAPAPALEQWYSLTDMIGFCAWLNLLVRKHKDLGLACLAQTVNVISPLMTRPDAVLKQIVFYPMQLFATLMKGGHLVQLPAMPDVYTGPTYPTWVQESRVYPSYIDMVAMAIDTEKGKSVRLSVLNRHPTASWTLKTAFKEFDLASVTIHEMYSDDLSAVNTWEDPECVVPKVTTLKAGEWESYEVKKHSWALFVFDGQ